MLHIFVYAPSYSIVTSVWQLLHAWFTYNNYYKIDQKLFKENNVYTIVNIHTWRVSEILTLM